MAAGHARSIAALASVSVSVGSAVAGLLVAEHRVCRARSAVAGATWRKRGRKCRLRRMFAGGASRDLAPTALPQLGKDDLSPMPEPGCILDENATPSAVSHTLRSEAL